MPGDDDGNGPLAPPGSLTFSQAQVNQILGNSLASLYRDLLGAPLPDHLQRLIDQLDRKLSSRDESE